MDLFTSHVARPTLLLTVFRLLHEMASYLIVTSIAQPGDHDHVAHQSLTGRRKGPSWRSPCPVGFIVLLPSDCRHIILKLLKEWTFERPLAILDMYVHPSPGPASKANVRADRLIRSSFFISHRSARRPFSLGFLACGDPTFHT